MENPIENGMITRGTKMTYRRIPWEFSRCEKGAHHKATPAEMIVKDRCFDKTDGGMQAGLATWKWQTTNKNPKIKKNI